jgi:hypothetical protein
MNVQINDYSSNGYINRTERYEDGTVTYRGYEHANGYFNIQVTTELNNGYRLEEQVSGTVYNDGYNNVQRQTISEQLPYARTRYGNYELQNSLSLGGIPPIALIAPIRMVQHY